MNASTLYSGQDEVPTYFRSNAAMWLLAAALSVVGTAIFYSGLDLMVQWWSKREEYSHGFLIPVITLYLVWQRSDRLREMPFTGSWVGLGVALLALGGYVLGELSTIYTVIQYAFVLFVIGAVWAVVGTAAFRVIAIPLLLLAFMVPFPNFIYNTLSAKLQLLSSAIGVGVIRLFGVSVYLEGNVIDLGTFKLQVVEACNGLRYLFPLMTLGVIVAYFFHAPLWKRLFVFVSTVPITILMNSFRIGVIGVMVEYWGQSMAEGFLHDFEGWAIFMACFGILFLEMWLLLRIGGDRRSLKEAFGIDPPQPPAADAQWRPRPLPRPGIVLAGLALVLLYPLLSLPDRTETAPAREVFASFPLELGDWHGRAGTLESIYLDALKLSDYALVDYRRDDGAQVNFYAAWYDSQKKGQSAHSPKSCLPGGGWEMESLVAVPVAGLDVGGVPLRVNRAVIAHGEHRQLVWYWFQQRGRVVTNEYLVKWYVFWDALTRNRTDGALVRLVAAQRPGQDIAELDRQLHDFAAELVRRLPAHVPP